VLCNALGKWRITLEATMTATVTAKGQITIPKAVRDALGVKPGSKVDFRRNADGHVEIVKQGAKPQSRFQKLRGSAGPGLTTDELMAMLRGD
jgi:AbrB family looped-hinge helix DNA binding protein